MIGKFNEFKNSLKTLKELESKLTNVDMSDPSEMLKNLGIDINEIEDNFNEQYPKVKFHKVEFNPKVKNTVVDLLNGADLIKYVSNI